MNREQRRSAGQRGPTQQADRQPVGSVLDAVTGHQIPGGCDTCTAFQTITQHAPGVFLLNVFHDDTCPELRRMTRS